MRKLLFLVVMLLLLPLASAVVPYDCSVNPLSAQHCFNFEGNVNDDIGGLTATNNGLIFNIVNNVSDAFGQNIQADDTGDGLDLGSPSVISTNGGDWSVCGWWRHDDINSPLGALWGSDNDGTDSSVYMLVNDNTNNRLTMKVTTTGGAESNAQFDFLPQITSADWNHLCFVANYTASAVDETDWLHFYINGTKQTALVSGTLNPLSQPLNNNLNLFEQPNSGRASKGHWDNFVIWNNTALTSAEVLQVFTGEVPLVFGDLNPPDNTIQANANVNFTVFVNHTDPFSAALVVNDSVQETKAYSNGTDILVAFQQTLSDGHYNYSINFTGGQRTPTHNLIIDTTLPLVTWTTPANDNSTIIGPSKTITLNILLANTNLKSYLFNITNATGSVLFTSSENLTSQITHLLDNTTTFTGQSDQTYTASIYVCDIADSCSLQERTFAQDSTPPTVVNLAPGNNTLDTDGTVTFSFTTTEAGNCSLLFNATAQTSISASVGSNTYPDQTFDVNTSVAWNVSCTDALGNTGQSVPFLLTVAVPTTESFFFSPGTCPNDSTANALLFGIILFFIFAVFIANELYMQVDGLNIFLGIAILICGWVIGGCSALLSAPFFAIGIFMMLFRTIMK